MKLRTRAAAFLLAALCLGLTGCANGWRSAPTVKSEFDPYAVGVLAHVAESGPLPGSPQTGEDTIAEVLCFTETTAPSLVRVCVWDSEQQGYTVHTWSYDPSLTPTQLAEAALAALDLPEGIGISEIRVEKMYPVIDLALTADSPAAETLSEPAAVEELLNTISMTMRQAGFYEGGFLLNGGQFSLVGLILEDDGYGRYVPPALYNQPVTGEEYTALRQLLPYPGLLPSEEPFTAADEAVRTDYPEVYSLVAAAGDVGIYTDPSQIPEEKRRSAALAAVPDTYRCQQDPAAWPEYPAEDSFLDVLFAAVDDTQLTPREWVDAAVQTIWGDAGAVTHGDAGQMTYHPTEGVYTPPHMGGGTDTLPHFFSVSETENGCTAEVCYLTMSLAGVLDENGEWFVPENGYAYRDDPELIAFAEERLPRYRLTFVRDAEEMLHLQSCEAVS